MNDTDTSNEFNQFLPEDFDAYLEEKWNSNMYTLPRRRVKEKLETMGRVLAQDLEQADLSLIMHLSDEFPSLWNKKLVDTQWLFFSRDETAREKLSDLVDKERTLASTLADPTPRFRQIFLGMALNKDHLHIGLYLHHDAWVDRSNLINLLGEGAKQSELISLFGQLPEHYEVVIGETEPTSPTQFNENDIDKMISQFQAQAGWLFMGARLPRDQVPILGAEVLNTARQAFALLIPLYRFLAWAPDNDAISLDTLVAERNETIKARSEELRREREEREAKLRQKEAEGLKLREEIAEKVRETQSWRQREMAARRAFAAKAAAETKQDDARAQAEAMAAKLGLSGAKESTKAEKVYADRDPFAKRQKEPPKRPQKGRTTTPATPGAITPTPAPSATKTVSPERAADIQVGDLVEVTKGFLTSRRGVVQQIDDKGGYRISFGALASRLEKDELRGFGPAPADQGRPRRRR